MRFVVYGAGAIGGVVGARLHQAGHDVTLIARGPHLDAIQRHGLRVESPDGAVTLPIPAVAQPDALSWDDEPVVLLGVKGQHTDDALRALAPVAPRSTALVCMQNGVDNERRSLRVFANTYGMCVMCPAVHLEPGVVRAVWSPITGMFDLGRYPAGADGTARRIAASLTGATCDSWAVPDIMRWKYRKLVMNLGNAIAALCGPEARASDLARQARAEGEAVLAVAGVDTASVEEDTARRSIITDPAPAGDGTAGSSWQSLARSTGSIEADYLSGEIVLLGRLHGVPTPVNGLLQWLADRAASEGWPPGTMTAEEIETMLGGTP